MATTGGGRLRAHQQISRLPAFLRQCFRVPSSAHARMDGGKHPTQRRNVTQCTPQGLLAPCPSVPHNLYRHHLPGSIASRKPLHINGHAGQAPVIDAFTQGTAKEATRAPCTLHKSSVASLPTRTSDVRRRRAAVGHSR